MINRMDEAHLKPSARLLTPADLRRFCNPGSLGFATTNDLPDLENVIGQPRAIRALEMGSEVSGPGYNTFVLGLSGSGRTTLSREYLQRKAAAEPVPDDWCYVNDFDNPRHPKALSLPAGRGIEYKKEIKELIQHCESDIARVFESDEYTQERDRLVGEMKKSQETEFLRLQKYVEKYSFVIVRTPFGFALVPAVEGKPLKPEEIEGLSEEQRSKLSQLQSKLEEEVEKSLNRLREIETNAANQIHELNERTTKFTLRPLMEHLRQKYAGQEQILAHLEAIQTDIVAHAEQFQSHNQSNPAAAQAGGQEWQRRYEVNLLVDNSQQNGAPVIVENHPSFTNLIGRIEHEAILGAARTDFTMIQPGALHRANGGYLILPARDLLMNPYAWEGLKRALRENELRIIELANQLGLVSTVTLDPMPIPLRIKAFLVGSPLLYYLLRAYDEDFSKLFKVRAEFGTVMERTPQTEQEYGLFVKSVVVDNQLAPFDSQAVARIIEYSSRMAEDQNKLSTRFGMIADLVREAAYWERKEGDAAIVTGEAVQKAIQESIYRSNLVEERIQEMIARGALMISVSGEAVGQVNALSVLLLGDYMSGKPSRVTASAYPGRGGVVDIERASDMGGPIHTKGVLILTGFLGERYQTQMPLSLSANLTFEQSYEGVEGDSASAAELFALLSAIANVPLRQDRAITGSVNQHGAVQPVGGVNEKIEGFFAACRALGINGEQGVIIPASNQVNLMLNEEVISAVEQGQFHIWSIEHVDEGVSLLTGLEPGARQADGSFPQGSFNRLVVERLEQFSRSGKDKANDAGEESKKTRRAPKKAESSEIEADNDRGK
jgi:lon-related putative ATP-dependent protease